jgi:hypothetical protein
MQVTISLDKDKVTLGQPVTITYSTEGFSDTQLTIPNIPMIDLGGGDQTGKIKVLPLVDGDFTVIINGIGDARLGSDSTCMSTALATCTVS